MLVVAWIFSFITLSFKHDKSVLSSAPMKNVIKLARNVVKGEAPVPQVQAAAMVDAANLARDRFAAQHPAVHLVDRVVKEVLVAFLARLAVLGDVVPGPIRRAAVTENIVAALGSPAAPIHAAHTVMARRAVGTEAVALQVMGVVPEEDVVLPARLVVPPAVVHSAVLQSVAAMRDTAAERARHVAGIRVVPPTQSAVLEGVVAHLVRHAVQEVVVTMGNPVVPIRVAPLVLVLCAVKAEVVVPLVRIVLWWTVSNFVKNHVGQAQSTAVLGVATQTRGVSRQMDNFSVHLRCLTLQ